MGEEGSGEHESTGYDSSSSSDSSSTATQDPWANQDPNATHDPSAASDPESQLAQAGQFYAAGNYQQAIEAVAPVYHSRSGDDAWGRAAYGMVMCYDKMGSAYYPQAADLMREIVQHVTARGWDTSQYVQQWHGYQNGQGWTGEFLLY